MFSRNRNNHRKGGRFGRRPSLHGRVLQEKRAKTRARESARKRAARERKKKRASEKKTLKPSELRRRHTLRARRRFIIWVVLWILLAGSFVFALASVARHESVTIDAIDVRGVEEVDREEVERLADQALRDERLRLVPRANIAAAPVNSIENEIAVEFPRVREVDVRRTDLTTLTITIAEREPAFLACAPAGDLLGEETPDDERDRCLVGDDTGFLFAYSGQTHPDTQETFHIHEENTLRIGETLFSNSDVSDVLSFVERIEEQGIEIHSIEIAATTDVRFRTDREYDILAQTSSDFEEVFLNLVTVLDSDRLQEELREKDIYEIDLRFGNKVFYRFRNTEETEE